MQNRTESNSQEEVYKLLLLIIVFLIFRILVKMSWKRLVFKAWFAQQEKAYYSVMQNSMDAFIIVYSYIARYTYISIIINLSMRINLLILILLGFQRYLQNWKMLKHFLSCHWQITSMYCTVTTAYINILREDQNLKFGTNMNF